MKPITKDRLTKEKRLIELESKMLKILTKSRKKMTVKELKGHFPNKASIATTTSILKVSNVLAISAEQNAGTTVVVDYAISGINLDKIIIGYDDGGNIPSGTLSNVFMESDNSIALEVYQNHPTNQKYSFTTSYIGNAENDFTQTNKPIESTLEYETITTKKN